MRGALALRAVGSTHAHAADAAGVSVRTLRYWLAAEWWREVEDEASAHEAAELVRLSVESLKAHLPEDARLALRVLERLDPRFQPVQRHAVQAVDGFHVDLRVAGES